MRRLILSLGLIISLMTVAQPLFAEGCYLCESGGHVAFEGNDSAAKRRKAKEQFACVVKGTTSACEKPKGTVEK
jgi:hypothetical protein